MNDHLLTSGNMNDHLVLRFGSKRGPLLALSAQGGGAEVWVRKDLETLLAPYRRA